MNVPLSDNRLVSSQTRPPPEDPVNHAQKCIAAHKQPQNKKNNMSKHHKTPVVTTTSFQSTFETRCCFGLCRAHNQQKACYTLALRVLDTHSHTVIHTCQDASMTKAVFTTVNSEIAIRAEAAKQQQQHQPINSSSKFLLIVCWLSGSNF